MADATDDQPDGSGNAPGNAAQGGRKAPLCDCGAPLMDALSERGVATVGADSFTFRRTTDWVACDACGAMHRMSDIVGDAPRPAPSGAPPSDPTAELLLDELRELSAD